MFQRLFFSGILSGVMAGIFLTVCHLVLLQPLILQAESYEKNGNSSVAPVHHQHSDRSSHSHNIEVIEKKEFKAGKENKKHWYFDNFLTRLGGLERSLYTFGANILTCIAFGLLLVSGFTIYGKPINLSQGLLWGGAGFLIFSFLPGLGLPPELPGSVAGDLSGRQIWWLGTVVSGVMAFFLLAFGKTTTWRVSSLIFFIFPHIIGAPQPEKGIAGVFPPELAAHFVMLTLFVAALTWLILAVSASIFYRKLST